MCVCTITDATNASAGTVSIVPHAIAATHRSSDDGQTARIRGGARTTSGEDQLRAQHERAAQLPAEAHAVSGMTAGRVGKAAHADRYRGWAARILAVRLA